VEYSPAARGGVPVKARRAGEGRKKKEERALKVVLSLEQNTPGFWETTAK